MTFDILIGSDGRLLSAKGLEPSPSDPVLLVANIDGLFAVDAENLASAARGPWSLISRPCLKTAISTRRTKATSPLQVTSTMGFAAALSQSVRMKKWQV